MHHSRCAVYPIEVLECKHRSWSGQPDHRFSAWTISLPKLGDLRSRRHCRQRKGLPLRRNQDTASSKHPL